MINKYLMPIIVFSVFLNLYLVSEFKTTRTALSAQLEAMNHSVDGALASVSGLTTKISDTTSAGLINKVGTGTVKAQEISDSALQQMIKRIIGEEISSSAVQAQIVQGNAHQLIDIQQKIDQLHRNMQDSLNNPGSSQTKDLILRVKEEILSQCKK